MEIYNENMEPISNPNLELGYLKNSTKIVHHQAVAQVKEIWHYETIAEYPNGGKDIVKVIDIPGVQSCDAYDEQLPIQIYVPYSEEQLAQENQPTQMDMIIECLLQLSQIVYS